MGIKTENLLAASPSGMSKILTRCIYFSVSSLNTIVLELSSFFVFRIEAKINDQRKRRGDLSKNERFALISLSLSYLVSLVSLAVYMHSSFFVNSGRIQQAKQTLIISIC